jgi:hypothetical protein
MSVEHRTFRPLAATQSIVATTSTDYVTLNNTLGARAIRMVNSGTALCFIEFSSSAAPTADSNTSMPLPAGQTEVFSVNNDIISYAVIADAAGSTIYSTVGEGL